MPKISTIYPLGKTQRELDFVDINPDEDFPVYLNPFVFSSRTDHFSIIAFRTIAGFFQYNLNLIRSGRVDEARSNFRHLNEPNETCFGMSKGRPRGNGMGDRNADEVFDSILASAAISSGLLEHLEDTAIFIPGIGKDKVSDMTTNIIRNHLIEYTQAQCDLLGIPLTDGIASGFFWDRQSMTWMQRYTRMLVINDRRILLVPKVVVSYVKEFTPKKYHSRHALEFLQADHIRRGTSLVHTTYNKDGSVRRKFVLKKELEESELPGDKESLVNFTQRYPDVFRDFRTDTAQEIRPIEESEFDEIDINAIVDHLISRLRAISPGSEEAGAYHSLMVGILEFIFSPTLLYPIKEQEIHSGRKRIDISFENGAPPEGFFYRLQHSHNIFCPFIPMECKNYSNDLSNPQLDQMVGRLSPSRGKFGLILLRSIDNEDLFLQRCSDSYYDDHGLIIPLTDTDIIEMLEEKRRGVSRPGEAILASKQRRIVHRS